MDEIEITLVSETGYETDADGNEIAKESKTTIFGERKSTTSAEFMSAGKLGLKPSCMVEVWAAEYSDEKSAIVDGERLSIYRTFKKGDRLELHLAERTGNRE